MLKSIDQNSLFEETPWVLLSFHPGIGYKIIHLDALQERVL